MGSCHRCWGSGEMPMVVDPKCSECHGSGTRYDSICRTCHGSGKEKAVGLTERCTSCGGSGEAPDYSASWEEPTKLMPRPRQERQRPPMQLAPRDPEHRDSNADIATGVLPVLAIGLVYRLHTKIGMGWWPATWKGIGLATVACVFCVALKEDQKSVQYVGLFGILALGYAAYRFLW